MMNWGTEAARPSSTPETSVAAEKALSFITKGWREVKDSADADIKLMTHRAKSWTNIAASAFSVVPTTSTTSTQSQSIETDFVKRLQPRLSEIQRVYSTPDFTRKVSKIWSPKAGFGINLPVPPIRTAMVSEVVDDGTTDEIVVEYDDEKKRERVRRQRKVKKKKEDSRWEWMGGEDGNDKEWEPIRSLKKTLKELERKGSSSDLFGNFKNGEFAEKVKSSLKSFWLEPQESSKEVPPLDAVELLACMVKSSGNLFGLLGFKEDFSQKIVETYCSRYRSQLLQRSLSSEETSVLESQNVNDELDLRIASVIQSTGHCYDGGLWTEPVKRDSVKRKRHFAIVTTASLPWMTGTAVNPLFRAAYLVKSAKQNVTLLVPWLCKSDQELVYPNNLTFRSPEEQESYIRNWLEERVGFKAEFKISFYPGKFSKERRSILPAGDTSQFISSKEADIAILEEPEHLNWYHHGKRWTDKFNHVVGVVHTNYLEYIKREKNGALQAFLVKHINNWVTRAYCNKVLRLSAATQDLPKSVICNVHGVNPKFLQVGEKIAEEKERGQQAFSKGAYFLGKMVWAKGYRELIDLLAKHKNDLEGFKLDVYGNGEDAHEVQASARKLDLSLNFLKGRDHADDSLHGYKVFINPSVSDVLCTATAEALAMGKFVVCADHPSNEFFRSFPNCLTYKTSEDFVARVREALDNDPQPLTPEQRYHLSWEAATQRFIDYSDLERFLSSTDDRPPLRKTNGKMTKSISLPNMSEMVDGGLAFAHYCLTGNEILRLSTGAIPGTRDPNKQHCEDLHLLPPQVENPIYGW